MSAKKTLKRFLIHYLVERPPLAVLYFLLKVLPLAFFLTLAQTIGTWLYKLAGSHRRRIRDNLDFAYGDKLKGAQKERIGREVTIHLLKNFLEVAYTVHEKNQPVVVNLISIQGKEHLDQALKQGNGVVAVSGHIGNFSLIGLKMSAAGYRFHTVIREISNPYQNRMYERYQKQLGQSFIPSRSFTQILKSILPALRNNEIVMLITDENRRRGGVFVDFFNHQAATAAGPAVLSLRTGAPIVPLFMVRNRNNTHTLIIHPPLSPPSGHDHQQAVMQITQAITHCIEDHIRTYPSQWLWTQKRWQTSPPGKNRKQ